ncbi:MAG: sterol desaturase family protein [Cyclobacteriaceae bacterium]|nr:sterol desaturase family protein [Cyclobacteriaceae bacterium]MDH4295003.1 sterol desaturase family protein [Cyclobacteriaceae bacterium]MDH5247616.1 sterol desaturase family protein [Cyclobacteriaceae bacterium]
MPNPIEILLDPVSLGIIGIYILLYFWETFIPRRKNMPIIKYATLRGLLSFIVLFYLSTYLPILTDAYLTTYQLLDLSSFNPWAQVIIGLFFYQFMLYLWHLVMHKSDTLWKVFHQMHHSAERMDIPSTFYFSPMDMIGFTLLGSVCFALVIGLSPQAITIIVLVLNFLSMFQHANIKTPRWLGYFIQRPEQHGLHHARGIHQYNYADFPIYDFMFGTFKNPEDYQGENGFYDGGSARVLDMLLFRNIAKQGQK